MPDTPIETARRVWPGEWTTIDLHLLRRRLTKGGPERTILPVIIEAHPSDFGRIWRVRLRSNGVGVDIGGPSTLAEALTAARTKVAESVIELANNIGLATYTPTRLGDAAVVEEILAERQRAFAKWGPQPHQWVDPLIPERIGEAAERLEDASRWALSIGNTWSAIIGEEAGEALREIDPKKARAELIQVAAMCLAALSECPDLQEVNDG